MVDEDTGLTKKERLNLQRQRDKLERALGGIKEMGGLPDIIVVIDTNKEEIAVKEAIKLSIPVVAIVDSNSNPDGVNYLVPGNDDALRAINLYCELLSGAVLDGLQVEMTATGEDVGESEEAPVEELPAEIEVAAPGVEPVVPAEPASNEGAPPEPVSHEGAPAAAETDPVPQTG